VRRQALRTMNSRYWWWWAGGGSWASGSQIGQVLALVSTGHGDLSPVSPTHTTAGAKPCQRVARFGDCGQWETHSPHPQLSQLLPLSSNFYVKSRNF